MRRAETAAVTGRVVIPVPAASMRKSIESGIPTKDSVSQGIPETGIGIGRARTQGLGQFPGPGREIVRGDITDIKLWDFGFSW